jgi:5-methylcytosine-specific restriction protein A
MKVDCEWSRCRVKQHEDGIATQHWHRAYAFIEREVANIPFDQAGTKEEFYPAWILELKATNVKAQLWEILANAIIRRDKFTCQDCGKTFKVTDYGVIYPRWAEAEVHHIIPRGLGGSDHPKNLKLVCVNCHQKYNEKFNGSIKRANRAKAKSLEQFEAGP